MIISVTPKGNLANRMIAYMCAKSLAWSIGGEIDINCHLPEWGLKFDSARHAQLLHDESRTLKIEDKDAETIHDLRLLFESLRPCDIVLDGFFQRLHLFDLPSRYQDLFPFHEQEVERFGSDELAIHVRAGDIVHGVTWYPLVPLAYFKSLTEVTGLKPAFIGQLGDSKYAREIKATFPNARMITSADPVADFNALRTARHICLSVSTFAWLSAWLSGARQIHFPLLGFLHPSGFRYGINGMGGIDLTPIDDLRYRFHLFPILQGSHENDYLDFTSRLNPVSKEVSRSVVRLLQSRDRFSGTFAPSQPFDERWYFREYIDAAWEVSQGWYPSAAAHYLEIGRRRGYLPHSPIYQPGAGNVSHRKKATQSSISEWSIGKTVEDDAARALDGDSRKEMAFHTLDDELPWWMVDLEASCKIECINIYNRRSNEIVRRRSAPLAIEFSSDGESWVRVGEIPSNVNFGAELDASVPLPYQWTGGASEHARYVRLALQKKEFFHLAAVEVYGVISSSELE